MAFTIIEHSDTFVTVDHGDGGADSQYFVLDGIVHRRGPRGEAIEVQELDSGYFLEHPGGRLVPVVQTIVSQWTDEPITVTKA